MKLKRTMKKSKGLSTIFVSIYLAILAVLLISILSIGVQISTSALNEYSRIEQERMQEGIVIAGPKALELSEDSYVERIRVNNTGSITVRIRAIYINHTFICDPSPFVGDAYIEPKESIWIQLLGNVNPPIEFDTTTKALWTVTTERGVTASEIGAKLLWGEPGEYYSPNKFYYGPLMLIFDMFHWRSESNPWNDGWTIPTGTPAVTWRILLVNIDERPIHIFETSCFTLISNDNAPKNKMNWYIDPDLSSTIFEPGVYNFVYYKWSKPFNLPGVQPQAVPGASGGTTCINFLTFFGEFEEADGSRTPFGQTVPFEAVRITK